MTRMAPPPAADPSPAADLSPAADRAQTATGLEAIQAGAPGLGADLARAGLRVLSWGWAAAQGLKGMAYATGLRRTTPPSLPLVCVGNLAVGGTGKTPFVAWLVERLRAAGRTPGILARGYGDAVADGLNDEGLVLRHLLGADVPQVQEADRLQGLARLRAAHPAVDVVVHDDGFQHRRLGWSAAIVLLDATRPFGYGHLLPRGLLREGPSALARADAVLVTRTERVDEATLDRIEADVRRHLPAGAPIAFARAEPGPAGLAEELAGAPVFAFCGIGNPAAFHGTLTDLGARVVGSRSVGDHEALGANDWPGLLAEARSVGAECVVTTRKDAVKYPALPSDVVVLDQELVIHRGEDDLLAVVERALGA